MDSVVEKDLDIEGQCNVVRFFVSYARQEGGTERGREMSAYLNRLFLLGASDRQQEYREVREAAQARGLSEHDSCMVAGMVYDKKHPSKSRARIVH